MFFLFCLYLIRTRDERAYAWLPKIPPMRTASVADTPFRSSDLYPLTLRRRHWGVNPQDFRFPILVMPEDFPEEESLFS